MLAQAPMLFPMLYRLNFDVELPNSEVKITRLKRLYPRMAVAVEGKPAAVIVPGEGSGLLRLAGELQRAVLERTGARLPIISARVG